MSLFDKVAETIGNAVRSFDLARGGGKRARRPLFVNAMTQAEKWKGGDLGAKDAAYRRAIQNSWIFQAINYRAGAVASTKFFVGVENENGEVQPVTAHPLLKVLRKPNPLMGRGYLWRYTQWWLDLSGNSYWFLAPDEDGELAEIWPLPANLVNPMPGDISRPVDYYEYTPNGQYHRIPAEYICHFRYPNPFDYFRGMSPLVAALLPADADSAMARWNGEFFGSGNVMPSAIINVSSGNPAQPIEAADVEAVKEQLESEFSASKRRTVVTGAFDMAAQLLGYNAKDMDFLAGRSFTRDEIYGIYGVPAGLLDKNATEANATVAKSTFIENVLWPLLTETYADTITSQIIANWYSLDQVAAFEDIRPINQAQMIQEAQASLPDMTRAERRARFWKLPPLGDERDGEIPGAQPAQPAPDLALPAGLPNPQNALPPAARSMDDEALADLRRWRRLAVKALKSGTLERLEFKSRAIPAEIMGEIAGSLKALDDADDIWALFSGYMTPAVKSVQPGDDPFQKVKKLAAADMEAAILEYFAGMAERIRAMAGDPAQ